MNNERIVRRAALGRKHPGHRVFVKRRRGQPVHRFGRNGDNAAGVQNLTGAVLKESREDLEKLKSYFSTVVRDKSEREGGLWKSYYEARRQLR